MHFIIDRRTLYVAKHPGWFILDALKAFSREPGTAYAGSLLVAYYALLSIVPLMILIVIALSRIVPQHVLLSALGHLLQWLVPGQSKALVHELANFLAHRAVVGWVLFVTMLFFSSLLRSPCSRMRCSLIFTCIAWSYGGGIFCSRRCCLIATSLSSASARLIVTVVSKVDSKRLGAAGIDLFGTYVSLQGASRALLYLLGLAGEIFVLTYRFIW